MGWSLEWDGMGWSLECDGMEFGVGWDEKVMARWMQINEMTQ